MTDGISRKAQALTLRLQEIKKSGSDFLTAK